MPGRRPSIKPSSAGESSGASLDDLSQLELHLQRQLEEDVARIFDESIYSDLEVVCGKLKILTHSCILKARTHKFYHKLEAILHVNIGRNTFDEIYSFISDAYTECDIQHQENEIIRYLNETLDLKPVGDKRDKQEEFDESDAYATPNCISPEEHSLQKTLSSSPSTELNKEYYSLVPIEGQISDKELFEQDELSSAFKSFLQLRNERFTDNTLITQCIKPTSLSLNSSHISKINKHSVLCDKSKDTNDSNSFLFDDDKIKVNSATSQVRKHLSEIKKSAQIALKRSYTSDTAGEYSPDSLVADEPSSSSDYLSAALSSSPTRAHAPAPVGVGLADTHANMNNTIVSDSGIDNNGTLETHSSHMDVTLTDTSLTESTFHLSGALSASPAGVHAPAGISFADTRANISNAFTIVSGSDIDDDGKLVALHSHKDVPSTDISLTESTFHELLNDDAAFLSDSASEVPNTKTKGHSQHPLAYRAAVTDMSNRTSKDEKQRHNEEIVILESSSLSSETGSWESVFPPKMPEKDLCEKFINTERQHYIEPASKSCQIKITDMIHDTFEFPTTATVQDSFEYPSTDVENTNEYPNTYETSTTHKSTSCFIDASSLLDEEERQQQQFDQLAQQPENNYRSSTRPLPCEYKQDMSPNDFSESNDNDDSLEQPDPDSIQKDLVPTIFEMSLVDEDSSPGDTSPVTDNRHGLPSYATAYEGIETVEQKYSKIQASDNNNIHKNKLSTVQTVFMTTTPNNSIISLKASDFSTYEVVASSSVDKMKHRSVEIPISSRPQTGRQDILEETSNTKYHESSLIISGGASIEDHLPQPGYSHSGSPMPKRKLENIPIVSGAYIPPPEEKPEKAPKALTHAAAWVVDMSKMCKTDAVSGRNKKPGDKTCDSLRASSKSGSNSEGCKSRSSVDSDCSEKSTHKFYIDLSTLPDALAPEQNSQSDSNNEKKNIFPMFIDLGDTSSTVKEMPARLSSSLNTKKSGRVETKPTPSTKTVKSSNKCSIVTNGDDNFEKLETLCDSSELTVSEILQNPIAKKISKEQMRLGSMETQDYHPTYPRDGIALTITEEPNADNFCDSFVRLSDLDRTPASKSETTQPKTECFIRMTRSIPDNNWGESSQTSSRSIDIISSFHSENALSLNRLFPHLKNNISRSMPGSLSVRTRSPFRLGDREEVPSDVSEISSVQSSMCRSVVENSTTEDTSHTSSLLLNCQSRLGQDLLRMFVEEIAPDVIVEVSGRRIKAHKCILSSRCQYFAGILSGGWVESAGNVISLPPFSFSVVHFALCHIYSGISIIPESISIVELATIADMLGLEGLKEAIMFTLKAKYCHHFHEPCQVCTAGVLECFPLSSVYGLDELYRRCLRWITRHFRKVWPTKAFATLPSELLDKCFQEHLLNLTEDNLVDTVYDCGIAAASLHRCRWAEVVGHLCRRLSAAAAQWAAARLAGAARAVAAARGPAAPAAARALDDCLAAAADAAPPDQLCRTLAYLHSIHEDKPDLIAESAPHADRLAALRRRVESALARAAPRALAAPSFRELPTELRRRLRDLARLNCRPPPRLAAPPDASANCTASIERVRASFVPYSPRPQRNPSAPRVRTTKAQEERAKFNLTKTVTVATVEKTSAKKGRPPYENAKPRYLEPRVKEPVRKPLNRLVSSSESSRNSSPVLARVPQPRARPRTADPSTDSLSDSLNTNKYATYTRPKRTDPAPPSAPKTQPPSQIKAKGTKIPVYQNQNAASRQAGPKEKTRVKMATPPVVRARASLMMATKSSSAKMVHKPVNETHNSAAKGRRVQKRTRSPSVSVSDIPVMERSGTFLKDEPTFGDKTTNIDIGECSAQG